MSGCESESESESESENENVSVSVYAAWKAGQTTGYDCCARPVQLFAHVNCQIGKLHQAVLPPT